MSSLYVDEENGDFEVIYPEERASRDEMFMGIAYNASARSTCLRRKVGAVLVKGDKIVTTGYNGAPRGCKHCVETGCLRDQLGIRSGERPEICRGAHAETNAIANAAYEGIRTYQATCYATTKTCIDCAKTLINAGIKEIIYTEEYAGKDSDTDKLTESILEQANIKVTKYTGRVPMVSVYPEERRVEIKFIEKK